jgi:hypothetical protein
MEGKKVPTTGLEVLDLCCIGAIAWFILYCINNYVNR